MLQFTLAAASSCDSLPLLQAVCIPIKLDVDFRWIVDPGPSTGDRMGEPTGCWWRDGEMVRGGVGLGRVAAADAATPNILAYLV